MTEARAPVGISHLEAGGNIYVALDGARISIEAGAAESGLLNLARPRLKQFALDEAVDEHGIDLFRALRWDYSLAETFHGREPELNQILRWAEGGGLAASARLLSGPGGAGKTRLGAEAARRLAAAGWTAGFVPADFRDRPFRIAAGKGLFLILDYPEERGDDTRWLIRLLADLVEAPCKIRVLLLSRRGFDAWEQEAALLEGRFGRQEIAALGGLKADDALALIGEAAR
ncbi:MAG: hypothetical protein ABSG83_17705, partial [Roseiarcus sp.]